MKTTKQCVWIGMYRGTCKSPSMLDTDYCVAHYYMSDDFLKSMTRRNADKDEEWRKELDSDLAAYEFSQKHGHKNPKEKDFPGYVDGFFYYSLREYEEERDFHQDWFDSYHYDGDGNQKNNYSFDNASIKVPSWKPYTLPATIQKELKVGHWDVIETIGHMKYVVVRSKADTKYYGVWLSMYDGGDVKTAMKYIRNNCPSFLPVRMEGYTYYTSADYFTYSSAKFALEKGMETFYKIKKRHKDAIDEQWIPPNLREIGYHKLFHLLPKKWDTAVREWVEGGCKGWNKTFFIPKKTKADVKLIAGETLEQSILKHLKGHK
jgi:hypothetical protein